MSRFKFKEREPDSLSKRQAESRGGDFDNPLLSSVKIFKPKGGENNIRLMPPGWDWDKKDYKDKFPNDWAITVYQHHGIGADDSTYLCLDKMKGEDCPICDMVSRLDADDAKEMKAKKTFYAYVIDRNNEKEGPLVWRVPGTMRTEILGRSKDKKSGAEVPPDNPDRGYDVFFNKTGEKLKTRYDGAELDRNDSPLHDDERKQDKWLDFIQDNPLPDLLQFFDADYLENVCKGKSSRRSEDKEDRGTRTSRGRSRDKEDEPAEEEDRRGRSRDRDEPKSRRDRDEPEPEDDTRSSRRGRDRDEPKEEARGSSRQRPKEDEDDRRTSRRSSRDEPKEEDEDDDRPSNARGARTRGRQEEDAQPAERGRRSGRSDPKPEEEDDEIPSERSSRRTASKDDRKEPAEEQDDTTAKARGKLERLKPKGGK